jgi:hypothetical protein
MFSSVLLPGVHKLPACNCSSYIFNSDLARSPYLVLSNKLLIIWIRSILRAADYSTSNLVFFLRDKVALESF